MSTDAQSAVIVYDPACEAVPRVPEPEPTGLWMVADMIDWDSTPTDEEDALWRTLVADIERVR